MGNWFDDKCNYGLEFLSHFHHKQHFNTTSSQLNQFTSTWLQLITTSVGNLNPIVSRSHEDTIPKLRYNNTSSRLSPLKTVALHNVIMCVYFLWFFIRRLEIYVYVRERDQSYLEFVRNVIIYWAICIGIAGIH